jgi:hypothetical protein
VLIAIAIAITPRLTVRCQTLSIPPLQSASTSPQGHSHGLPPDAGCNHHGASVFQPGAIPMPATTIAPVVRSSIHDMSREAPEDRSPEESYKCDMVLSFNEAGRLCGSVVSRAAVPATKLQAAPLANADILDSSHWTTTASALCAAAGNYNFFKRRTAPFTAGLRTFLATPTMNDRFLFPLLRTCILPVYRGGALSSRQPSFVDGSLVFFT